MDGTFLLGMIPLLIFVVADSFSGLKTGVILAMAFALLEAIWTWYTFGRLDEITIGTLGLFTLMGIITLKTKQEKYFLFQPVVLGGILGSVFLASYLMGSPILPILINKYSSAMPSEMRELLKTEAMQVILVKITFLWGLGFLVHAGLTAWAALRLNKWWWLAIRGVGIYIVLILFAIPARF